MKYYEMHEKVYEKLKAEGLISWDKSSSFDELWTHGTNVHLDQIFKSKELSFKGLRVLDLGTGMGTSALFAAKEGAAVTAVEISSSALEVAEANALKLGVKINFIKGDVLELSLGRKFDLIIDSTILHCIVGQRDRTRFYDVVKAHLASDGYFFVNTMLATPTRTFPAEFFHFEDNILWSLGINEISERKIINGKSYFPHRMILTYEDQLAEFKEQGFTPVFVQESESLVALLKI